MNKLSRALAIGGATVGGIGFIPVAPGTFGTLAALPLFWAMAHLALWPYLAVLAVLTALAVYASELAERIYQSHDLQHIVVDEVVGLLVTTIAIPFSWKSALAAFVLFRIFDVVKPWPIRWIDDHAPGGFGVVADDVAAGLAACLVMHIVGHFLPGGWV